MRHLESLLKQIRQLKARLIKLFQRHPKTITEDEFLDKMAARGFLTLPRDRRKDKDRYANRTLVPYIGRKPSEILVEERR